MQKSYFKLIDEENNIFEINGLKVQIIDDKPYKFSDSFKPSIYEYEFCDEVGHIYRGKSFCGCSGRFCNHITHNVQRIDKELENAKDCGYLVKIRLLDICGSMIEMDTIEEQRIHELTEKVCKEISGDINYNSYLENEERIKGKILNEILL